MNKRHLKAKKSLHHVCFKHWVDSFRQRLVCLHWNGQFWNKWFLAVYGSCDDRDLLNSKCNHFISVPNCTQVVNLVKFPRTLCNTSHSLTFSVRSCMVRWCTARKWNIFSRPLASKDTNPRQRTTITSNAKAGRLSVIVTWASCLIYAWHIRAQAQGHVLIADCSLPPILPISL